MTTSDSSPSETPPQPLDAQTERKIMNVMLGGYNSVSELRQRIRELVEEAATKKSTERTEARASKPIAQSLSSAELFEAFKHMVRHGELP